MEHGISIDKYSSVPVYKQLYVNIAQAVAAESMRPSDKLPSERSLSAQLGISRGTVKRAYTLLIKDGFLTVGRGSGTYVAKKEAGPDRSCQDKISAFISDFVSEGYTVPEITVMFRAAAEKKQNSDGIIQVAAIDCNPETLEIIRHQVAILANIRFAGFLLHEITSYSYPTNVLDAFDFILTTTTHYDDLAKLISPLEKKIVKTVLSPDVNTIAGLNAIPKNANVGIVTESARFAHIIESNLKNLNCGFTTETFVISEQSDSYAFKAYNEKSYLIIPPAYALMPMYPINKQISDYCRHGGNVVIFNYTIERGSFIYIEEKAKNFAKKI